MSLTLTPVMCSLFLKEEGLHPKGRFNRGAERVFQAALRRYDRGLNFIFRHQFAALMATLLLMVATGYLYVKMPKGFFPQQDTGFIFGELDVRQDASMILTDKIRRQGRRYRQAGSRRARASSPMTAPRLQPRREYRPHLLGVEAL